MTNATSASIDIWLVATVLYSPQSFPVFRTRTNRNICKGFSAMRSPINQGGPHLGRGVQVISIFVVQRVSRLGVSWGRLDVASKNRLANEASPFWIEQMLSKGKKIRKTSKEFVFLRIGQKGTIREIKEMSAVSIIAFHQTSKSHLLRLTTKN